MKGEIISFEVTEDTIAFGYTSVVLNVQCVRPGIIGNVPQYSIKIALQPLAFVQTIYNPDGFIMGLRRVRQDRKKEIFQLY